MFAWSKGEYSLYDLFSFVRIVFIASEFIKAKRFMTLERKLIPGFISLDVKVDICFAIHGGALSGYCRKVY